MRALQIDVQPHSIPIDTQGFSALKRVSLATLASSGGVSNVWTLRCDALLVSGGWSPTLHLFAQAGGKLRYSESAHTFVPPADVPRIELVGSAALGTEPAQGLGERVSPVGNKSRQWIDLRHDVTVADFELSVRESFSAVEHIKRYTTLGMSVDQGKLGQAPAMESQNQ